MVNLGIESAELPGGRRIDLEVVRHPGGAAAAAVDADGRVCLLRQFRHAAGGWLWEVPAGKVDPGEAPLQTAQRELEEEAGLRGGEWAALGAVLPTPGFCDEAVHLFLATRVERTSSRHHAHEVLEVHWVSLAEALAWGLAGEIRDAKTLVALFRAAHFLGVAP